MRRLAVAMVVLVALSCTTTPSPSVAPSSPAAFDFPVECGPIEDAALCREAVEVAATAKLNPPPIAAVMIRRPRADDDCIQAFRECGPTSVVVTIQSGDTLQEIPLVPTADGWVRLDLIR
jgi:hypothetical protein